MENAILCDTLAKDWVFECYSKNILVGTNHSRFTCWVCSRIGYEEVNGNK